jgi:heme exporter protein CcmD
MLADPNIAYVVAAYLVAGLTLSGMIAYVVLDHRRLSASLKHANRALETARDGTRGAK